PTIDPTGGGLGAIRASVQVSIPATTLAGTTSGGAELNGKCAIDPATVRILAGKAPGFDRVFLHPVTAEVLTTDRYTPTAGIKRFLQARYVRCAFPGCRRPAMRSEIDHHREYANGGKTDGDNLGPCCTRHHVTRHAAGWTVEQLPGGRLKFTAPSG
ncbi:HNH endonuclease signature motif containing protein, partial [Microbacterium aurantiacum]|uniref:HNH endonuclease signature motif containing protein n=1 Tax=Microbacterium aurantiacum TaxID=162393 RepID=UPI00403761BF